MAHTLKDKDRLVGRINRLQGQLKAATNALEQEEDCYKIMLTLASCRGALNGLMADIMEEHIREHIGTAKNSKEASLASEEAIEILRSFWK